MSVTTHPKVTTFPEPASGDFAFTKESQAQAEKHLAKYPEHHKASAVVPLLWIAQRQLGGYLTTEAIEYVAKVLEMAPIRVHEVATFYSMFNHQPVGKHFIQVCRTTPCWLRGADELARTAKEKLGVDAGEVTEDGLFSVREVECLGACCNAPMVQINDDYYEDLTSERLSQIIDDLRAGKEVPVGSQIGRVGSEQEGGPHVLTEISETGHASYPFGSGEDVEPEEVRKAREEAAQDDGQAGDTSGKGGGS
ncbi:NADH-quinone oxidoreductase subunit NuoE [Ferruginivarius sediminum]|uniref:NADH-quinone oxidoreductase subunit NuoE n=1 Tax=Ferruginivarius sediminum TaxID=2661937 RepID=A0A369TA04_9PROT|nr:NADH-quinone oxidoreductase subunit NuoE [Ferruginivarius sediminum]RDD62159.1 NADH-quinone oxidoreductase subunit NuoE [Ferruginivarius sediminum]